MRVSYVILLCFLLGECTASFAKFVIPLHYWRKNARGNEEELTIVFVLDDYYGRNFNDPTGLLPLLLKGKLPEGTSVDSAQAGVQREYLDSVRNHQDVYGANADAIAAHIQSPEDLSKAPNSGMYVFDKDGNLVFSFRLVAPNPGEDLPEIAGYRKSHGANAPIPKEITGLVRRRVGRMPQVTRDGVFDISHPPPETGTEVVQGNSISIKSFFPKTNKSLRIVPELFNLARWMFEYTNSRVPDGTKYTNGVKAPANSGAYTSNIYCDCYTGWVRNLYLSMGFKVWAEEKENGSTHYWMVGTPETLNKALNEDRGGVRERLNKNPGAALVKWDGDLMRRLRAGLGEHARTGLPCDFSVFVRR